MFCFVPISYFKLQIYWYKRKNIFASGRHVSIATPLAQISPNRLNNALYYLILEWRLVGSLANSLLTGSNL